MARIESRRQPGANSDDAAESAAADSVANAEEPADDPADAGHDSAVGGKALPLSA